MKAFRADALLLIFPLVLRCETVDFFGAERALDFFATDEADFVDLPFAFDEVDFDEDERVDEDE